MCVKVSSGLPPAFGLAFLGACRALLRITRRPKRSDDGFGARTACVRARRLPSLVAGMSADPIVPRQFHRQRQSLGDSKGGPHPPLACFLCGVTAFRVETGALRSVAVQARRLRIHFPVSPSQIRNTVSDLKGRMKKRTWSFRLQPETKCSAFILTRGRLWSRQIDKTPQCFLTS